MIVNFGWPKYMPSPYSVYISNFGEQTLRYLKKSDTLARYHKEDKEYEITPEVYEHIKSYEENIQEMNKVPENIYEEFVYHTDYDYQYQDDAVNFMHTRLNGLLNFSQGCGKTFTTLKILEDHNSKKILVIVGVGNLQEEWIKDGRKHISKSGIDYVQRFNMRIVGDDPGVPVPKRIEWLRTIHTDEEIFLDLISIESLRSEEVIAALNALKYDAVVVDEVQTAKGMKAEQTMGLHELTNDPNQLRLALSGTPALNDPLEFYSVLRFLRVLYYKSLKDQCSRSAFNKYYGDWGFDYWGHYVCNGYRNKAQLKQLLAAILIYVPKSVLNLLPKHRQIIAQPVQNPRYEELTTLYEAGSKAAKKAGYATIQAVAAELQIMTCTEQWKIDFISDHAKQGNRPLVFSRYTAALEVYKKQLEEQGYAVEYYNGKLNSKKRLAVLDRWKSGQGDALLLQIDMARYGLNLQQTQTAIFVEPPYTPGTLEQAEDRLHRIGQEKEVFSYILVSGKSDEDGIKRLERKTEVLAL